MVKNWVPKRFVERIEKLMGKDLQDLDLKWVHESLPVAELELLKSLAAVDSQTLKKPGVRAAQEIVAFELESLGFENRWIPSSDDRFSDLLVAERPGRTDKFITLVTHTDTVLDFEHPFALDLEGARATGSGVIDNKGGVVVGLSALARLLRNYPETEYSLRFLCSPNEEMGSIGFTDYFRELGPSSVFAFGLEPALDNGSIVHQRRGNRWYTITWEGREAHAGRSYGQHGNVAHDLAQKIYYLSQLTHYKKHMSVNVGHISAGKDRHNIICGRAQVKLDVRFSTIEQRDYMHRKIEKILAYERDPTLCGEEKIICHYDIVDDCPPFSLTRRSKALARKYAALTSQLENRKVFSQPAGGAGDVNYLSTPTNFVLDGLGPVGGGMHTTGEFLDVQTLTTRSQALATFLKWCQGVKY
ncbi:MAG: M20/M25/M40 family metallo-hydrolase [Bdellovibrionales bacterium]